MTLTYPIIAFIKIHVHLNHSLQRFNSNSVELIVTSQKQVPTYHTTRIIVTNLFSISKFLKKSQNFFTYLLDTHLLCVYILIFVSLGKVSWVIGGEALVQ